MVDDWNDSPKTIAGTTPAIERRRTDSYPILPALVPEEPLLTPGEEMLKRYELAKRGLPDDGSVYDED